MCLNACLGMQVAAEAPQRAVDGAAGVANFTPRGLSSSSAAGEASAASGDEDDEDFQLIELEVPVLVRMNAAFVLVDYPGYGGSQADTPSPESEADTK